jgi:flagellar biosynthesis protein FlhA
LNSSGDLPAYFVDASIEQSVESAVQHGEQSSHLTLAPQIIRDILNKVEQKVGSPETPVVAVTSTGARYFLRQIVEASRANVVFLSHNEIPAEVKVISQGFIQ